MDELLNILFEDKSFQNVIKKSEDIYLMSELGASPLEDTEVQQRVKLCYLFINFIYSDNNLTEHEILNLTQKTYVLLKSVDISLAENKALFNAITSTEGVDVETIYYFFLSSVALKSDKIINIRLDLQGYTLVASPDLNWKYRLLNDTLRAFILLVRKANGFKDIREALEIIHDLQINQSRFEAIYLRDLEAGKEIEEALELLGFYHLSKTIVETAVSSPIFRATQN